MGTKKKTLGDVIKGTFYDWNIEWHGADIVGHRWSYIHRRFERHSAPFLIKEVLGLSIIMLLIYVLFKIIIQDSFYDWKQMQEKIRNILDLLLTLLKICVSGFHLITWIDFFFLICSQTGLKSHYRSRIWKQSG